MESFCAVLFPLDVLDEIWDVIESVSEGFLTYTSAEGGARGLGQFCAITLLHMNRLNKTESVIFVSLICSLVLEDLH